jgi:hypothetical protein
MHPMSSHFPRHTPPMGSSLLADRNSPVQRAGSRGTTGASDFYLLLGLHSLELLSNKRNGSEAQETARNQKRQKARGEVERQ